MESVQKIVQMGTIKRNKKVVEVAPCAQKIAQLVIAGRSAPRADVALS